MEPNQSRPLDWKVCFKKILAPHLLNSDDTEELDVAFPLLSPPGKGQNDASRSLNSTNSEEQKNVSIIALLKDPEKLENVQKNVNSSIAVESVYIDDNSRPFVNGIFHCQDLESSYGKLDNAENPIEEEDVEKIIAADAEQLAKSFKALKVRKKDKHFFNMAENIRNPPDWNIAFKQVLDPKFKPANSLKTPEVVDGVPKVSHPEVLDKFAANSEFHHRLCKEKSLKKVEEAAAKPSSKKSKKKRVYSKEELEILEILNAARRFKPLSKSSMNDFDGAGVNCFKYKESESSTKNKSSKTEKPKNIPPPNRADGAGVNCFKYKESFTKNKSSKFEKPKYVPRPNRAGVNYFKYKESEFSAKNKSPEIEKPKNVPPPNGWVCVPPYNAEEQRKRPHIMFECWDWDDDGW